MITIKTKRVVVEGEPMLEVTKIRALHLRQLPEEYIQGYPVAYASTGLDFVDQLHIDPGKNESAMLLREGHTYTLDYVHDFLTALYECGERLQRINKEILLCNWKGTLEFRI